MRAETPTATRQRPPTHPGPACIEEGFYGDLNKISVGETRNGDCSPLHSLKRCVSPLRQRLAVVKWYSAVGEFSIRFWMWKSIPNRIPIPESVTGGQICTERAAEWQRVAHEAG